MNSSCDPSSGARLKALARAFGKAKSQAHRDDNAARVYGAQLCASVKIARLSLGYTKQELADECDVGMSVISAMEDGFVPSISIINRAFSFLGFDLLADLVGTSL